ncbi:MAG: c-type cytochrome [Rhodothermales bacterium]
MKALKLTLRILGVLVILLLIAGVALFMRGSSAVSKTYEAPVDTIALSGDSATLALGEYIVRSHGCQDCHGANLSGTVMVDAPPFLVAASNLTPGAGGIGTTYTDADWIRTIRHGVKPNGAGTWVMPSEAYYYLNDRELGALVSYLKQLPAVDNTLPATEIRPMGRVIAGMDAKFRPTSELITGAPRLEGREPGPTAEWGEYRASVMCVVCHGQGLTGAQPPNPDAPFAPDLRMAASWSLDDFKSALRTGVTPDGRELDPEFMPWTALGQLSEDEMTAIHLYLQTL